MNVIKNQKQIQKKFLFLKKIQIFNLLFFNKTRILLKKLQIIKKKKINFLNIFWNKKNKRTQLRTLHTRTEQTNRFLLLKKCKIGLQAMTYGWITNKQLESMRKVLTRSVKNKNKIWLRTFLTFRLLPNKALTKKPQNIRMGKGKGGLQGYIFQIKKGRILVEANSPKNITINFKKTLKKLPPFIRILHNKNTNFLN